MKMIIKQSEADSVMFFDEWSEECLSEKDVAIIVAKYPEAAHKYHVASSNITYARFQESKVNSSCDESLPPNS